MADRQELHGVLNREVTVRDWRRPCNLDTVRRLGTAIRRMCADGMPHRAGRRLPRRPGGNTVPASPSRYLLPTWPPGRLHGHLRAARNAAAVASERQ